MIGLTSDRHDDCLDVDFSGYIHRMHGTGPAECDKPKLARIEPVLDGDFADSSGHFRICHSIDTPCGSLWCL